MSPVLLGSAIESSPKKKLSAEELHKRLDEAVDKYGNIYGSCSQTSFIVLNEAFHLKSDNIVRGLAPFPGIALRGETCGAVSGSLMAIGLVYEDDIRKGKGKKGGSGKPSFDFCSKFESEFGSTRCRNVISKVNNKEYQVTKPEDYAILSDEKVYGHCVEVVKKAVHLAADIILAKG